MKSRQALVAEADKVFSSHVRSRDTSYEWNHCFTCSLYLPISQLQAGHFIPRRYYKTRWHPLNVWPQCYICNITKGGNLENYEKRLVRLYTQEAVDQLWELALSTEGVEDWEIQDIIKKYKTIDNNS